MTIYEFDNGYYLNLEYLQNEELKEWIIDNSFEYDEEKVEERIQDIKSNFDFGYYDLNWDDDRDKVVANVDDEFCELYQVREIMERGEYIDLEEGTQSYEDFINKYKDAIKKCGVNL